MSSSNGSGIVICTTPGIPGIPGPQGPPGVDGAPSDMIFDTYADAQAYGPVVAPETFTIRGQAVAGDYGASPFIQEPSEPMGLSNQLMWDPDFNKACFPVTVTDRIPGEVFWVAGGGWSFMTGKAFHTTGTAPLSQAIGSPYYGGTAVVGGGANNPHYKLKDGGTYRLFTRIAGRTAGTVTPRFTGGSGTVTGTAIAVNGSNYQDIVIGTDHVGFEFLPSSDFDGAVAQVGLYQVRNLGTRAKIQLTLADGVTKPWYRRTPTEIRPEMCKPNASLDFHDPNDALASYTAIREACTWAQFSGVPLQFGPGIYYVHALDNGHDPIFTLNQYDQTGNFTLRGVGMSTIIKNLCPDWHGMIFLAGGDNIHISNLVLDCNAAENTAVENGFGILLHGGPLRRVRLRDIWVKNSMGYGIAMAGSDVMDVSMENITITNAGDDGIDIKSFRPSGGVTDRKESIRMNNIFVDGWGAYNTREPGKAGIDIRGYVLANNIYINFRPGGVTAGHVGVRLNSDALQDNNRRGARKSQVSNVYVLGQDASFNEMTNVYTPVADYPNCNIGIGIYTHEVNVSNAMIECCGLGMEISPAGGAFGDLEPAMVGLKNVTILGSRLTDGHGAGMIVDGSAGTDSISMDATIEYCDTGLRGRTGSDPGNGEPFVEGDNAFGAVVTGKVLLRANTLGHNLNKHGELNDVQTIQNNFLDINYVGNTQNNLEPDGYAGRYFSNNVRMIAPVTPTLALMEDGNRTSYTRLTDSSTGLGGLVKISTTGDAFLDIGAIPVVENDATVRVFREANVGTAGIAAFNIYRGDNTSGINHSLKGNDHSYLCAYHGNLLIGDHDQSTHKLMVEGNICTTKGFIFPVYSKAAISDINHAVNQEFKVQGKAIWQEDDHMIMVAVGSLPGHGWVSAAGETQLIISPE